MLEALVETLTKEIVYLFVLNFIFMSLPQLINNQKLNFESILVKSFVYAISITIGKFLGNMLIGSGDSPITIGDILFVPLITTISIYTANIFLKIDNYNYKNFLIMWIENISIFMYMDWWFIVDNYNLPILK